MLRAYYNGSGPTTPLKLETLQAIYAKIFLTVRFFYDVYTINFTSDNFVSKGGRLCEISPKVRRKYVHAGRIILIEKRNLKKRYAVTGLRFKVWSISIFVLFT